MRRLPLLTAALALGAALVLAGCGGDKGGGGDDAVPPATGVSQVTARDNRFTPAAIQIPAGTEVTWIFKDGFVPHDVVADGFNSGKPRRKGTFAHTFDRPGTYAYRCSVHDGMTGRVVVTAAS